MNGEPSSDESSLPEVEDFSNAVARDPLVDTTLDGRFVIEEVLGKGGMSVVYKARQLTVNRHVAVKTLRMQNEAKPIYKERFEREINSLCALNHPNIVTVYDCIMGTDDQPYVVMDYLRGRSLEALIEAEGPLAVARFASIAMQVCSALDHAHKKGIVHRDLKPGNIVLIDNETDLVKVVDFGLAKLTMDNRSLTQSGELWGSPPYMSPEQCMGESGDERSDIYSLGAVMYEMIVGKDPFNGARSVFDFIQRHIHANPPPFFQANPYINVSIKLESVIFKALEKSPLDRFQTAQELQDAIVEACSEDSSKLIFHPSRVGRTSSGVGIEIGATQDDHDQKLKLENSNRSDKSLQVAWFAGMLEAGALADSASAMLSVSNPVSTDAVRDAIAEVASGKDVLFKAPDAVSLGSSAENSLTAQEKAVARHQQAQQEYPQSDKIYQTRSNPFQISDSMLTEDNTTQHSLSDSSVSSESSSPDIVAPLKNSSDGLVSNSNWHVWTFLTLAVVLLVGLLYITLWVPKKTEPSAVSVKHEKGAVKKHRRPKIPVAPTEDAVIPGEPTNQSTDIEM